MIKKLIKRFEMRIKFNSIERNFEIAKKHKSQKELEKVKSDLIYFKDILNKNNLITEKLNFDIYNLFAEIDYARLNIISSKEAVINI